MATFEFSDGRFLGVSVEIRKEQGESYSPLRGLFRQYELMYVIADERDVLQLRTNYRKDSDLYLYEVVAGQEATRAFLVDMMERAADIAAHRQNGQPNAVDILSAIDRRCAVPLVSIDSTWFALKVESGESLLALWDRVRAAGARCNRTYTAIVERVQQILYAEAQTNSNMVARMAYDFLGEVADKYHDAAALEMMLRTRLLSRDVILPEVRKERQTRPRPGSGTDELANVPSSVLATSPSSAGYDITVGLKAFQIGRAHV